MFLIDIRKFVPLDVSALNLGPANITHDTQKCIIKIPLTSCDLEDAVSQFAFDIASREDWHWPDLGQTTAALEIDYSRSFLRVSRRVGTQPQKSEIETDLSPEWAEFEDKRREALQAHIKAGGEEATDIYALLLDERELTAVTTMLYTHFAIF